MADRTPAPNREVDRDNPWPGLATFTEDSRGFFFGREAETDELSRLVRRQTLTVLFGQSGLGKSSLIQAGLFPILREGDHLPLYLRLDHSADAVPLEDQVKASLTAAIAAAKAEAPAFRPGETLWEYFHRKDVDIWSSKNRLLTPVLAFDQFEEIFTLGRDSDACSARSRTFLAELACLVENRPPASVQQRLDQGGLDPGSFHFDKPSCQVILSLREDFLPDLEGLRREMPALVHNRLRLRRLNGTAALDVVQKPAPHLLAPGVAEKIVEFVAGARGGSAERLAELDVEPPLLSVICRELNERRRSLGQAQITADLVSGNRREILNNFYERSVADLPAPMRAFIEDRLLTKSGFRDNLALETALEIPGVTRPLLDMLVARRLLRIEERLGVQRVELTHDVLAEVIRASRDERQQRLALADSAREARRQRKIIAALGLVVAALCVGGVFGLRAQRRAEEAQRVEAMQSSRTDFILANQLLTRDRVREGLAYLVRAANSDPSNEMIGDRLVSALAWRSFATPSGSPFGPKTPIADAGYTGDGSLAWTRGDDNRLTFWDLKSGKSLPSIKPSPRVYVVATSRDGKHVASAGVDGILEVWDIATGRPVPGTFGTGASATCVAFSPDGRWVAVGGADGTTRIWQVEGAKLAARIKHGPFVGDIDFDPASRRLLVSSAGGSGGRIFSVPDGAPLTPNMLPARFIYAGRFSPDGKWVALCSDDDAQLVDSVTGDTIGPRMRTNSVTRAAAFSPDGTKLATLSIDRNARVWQVPSGRLATRPIVHEDTLRYQTSFSADSKLIVTTTVDGAAHIWEVATGHHRVEPIRSGDVVRAELSRTGDELLTGGRDGLVRLWHITPGAVQPWHLAHDPDRILVAPGPDRKSVWILTNGQLRKVDPRSGLDLARPKPMPKIDNPDKIVYQEFSSDGHFLGLRTNPDRVELFDLRGPQGVIHELTGNTNKRFLTFSADGTRVAVGDGDGMIRVWDTRKAALAFREIHSPGWVSSLRFAPDGTRIALLSMSDGVLRFLDTKAPHAITAAKQFGTDVADIKFSPDGRLAGINTLDNKAQIWELATSRPISPLLEHRDAVLSVEFSSDSRRMFTRSPDSLRVWDTRTGAPVTELLSGGGQRIVAAAFSLDGARVATANEGGEVRVWDIDSGQMIAEPIRVAEASKNYLLNFDATGQFISFSTTAGNFYVWALPPPASGGHIPGWLLHLATAIAGGTVDGRGVFRESASDMQDITQIGSELANLPDDSPYAAWGRWFLADRATRPIAPGFKMTAAEMQVPAASVP